MVVVEREESSSKERKTEVGVVLVAVMKRNCSISYESAWVLRARRSGWGRLESSVEIWAAHRTQRKRRFSYWRVLFLLSLKERIKQLHQEYSMNTVRFPCYLVCSDVFFHMADCFVGRAYSLIARV